MDADAARALVLEYYERIYNGRELDAIDGFLAPSFVSVGPGASMDRATHVKALAASLAALPDLRLTIEEQVAEGGTVVTRWSVRGTHQGPLFGIPATGRPVTASAIHIHHVDGGRMLDQWEQFDALGVLRQLGVLPGMG